MLEPATRPSALAEPLAEHLRGAFAPVADELDVADLPVRGELPEGLEGTYVRNGPNPQFAPIGSFTYPFDGDGMLHAVTFEGGRVRYRNRWVVTRGLVAERRAGHALFGGTLTPLVAGAVDASGSSVQHDRSPFKNWSNTNVVRHAGKLLSLGEGGCPYELTSGLGTVGEYDYRGALPGGMTAHPKIDPVWDELCWFRSAPEPPYLVYGVVDPRGKVVRTVQVDIPRPVLMHDFAVTDQHVVLFDSPAVVDLTAAARGEPVLRWVEEEGTRVGVMPRDGDTASARWFPVENRFVMHVVNAFTEGSRAVVDYIHRRQLDPVSIGSRDDRPKLYRSVIDLGRGSVSDELLDGRIVELPRIDERRTGLPYRFAYLAAVVHGGGGANAASFDTLLKIDLRTTTAVEHRFPEGIVVGEAVFVPRPSSRAEDDGWLLAFTYDTTRDTSDLVVLAAADPSLPPLATVPMPRRVPAGLHGTWLPAQ